MVADVPRLLRWVVKAFDQQAVSAMYYEKLIINCFDLHTPFKEINLKLGSSNGRY